MSVVEPPHGINISLQSVFLKGELGICKRIILSQLIQVDDIFRLIKDDTAIKVTATDKERGIRADIDFYAVGIRIGQSKMDIGLVTTSKVKYLLLRLDYQLRLNVI